jgi:hypothetical protein
MAAKKIPIKAIMAGVAIVAILGLMAVAWTPSQKPEPYTPPTTPTVEANGTKETPPVAPPACDHDEFCDVEETREGCPGDCIPSKALAAERSDATPSQAATKPVVTVTMQDPDGVQSCGVSETDAAQWACAVKSPGAIVSEVDCTLQNYQWDGKYMLILRCKDTKGNDIPPAMMDDVIVCADPLGCKR